MKFNSANDIKYLSSIQIIKKESYLSLFIRIYYQNKLPDLGSNQDFSVPETDVLPITPSGNFMYFIKSYKFYQYRNFEFYIIQV